MPETSWDVIAEIEVIEPAYSEAEPTHERDDSREEVDAVAPGELVVGILLGLGESGEIFVTHPLSKTGVPRQARSMVPLGVSDIGREVVLSFERGDLARPLIVGCLWKPSVPVEAASMKQKPSDLVATSETESDELVLTAGKRIVLRCGEASLTLTEEGKVLIQGAYVSSRSTGAHRIKGASVQIN